MGIIFTRSEVRPMNVGEAVKERIVQLCQEADISIKTLSRIRGVTQSTVNNIVSGRHLSTTIPPIAQMRDGPAITIS